MIEYHYDEICWYEHELAETTFRKNGPCKITTKGMVQFSQIDNKSYNRKEGPSVILQSGSIGYTSTAGVTHRSNGPAVIHSDGRKEYWVDGKKMLAEEFFATHGVV